MAVILRLTNSDDFNERVPEAERATVVAERVFTAETGEAAHTVSKVMWPTPPFPVHLDRWLDETKPDVVVIRLAAYWVTFRSVPLRLKRRIGRVGEALSDVGTASARVHWLAESPPYHLARRALLRTIGGDANFTVDEVMAVLEASARRVLAREGTVLVVRGPQNALSADVSPKALAWAEARRFEFHRRARDLCERLHVEYIGRDEPYATGDDPAVFFGDLVHATALMHRVRGEEEGMAMAAAWKRER
ncbi:MAG: hypothetical protein IT302_08220 [Dehalococcoidia bacterium]|nr:hypothetical protein [Dehalococcoidia bacterium]